LLSSLLQEIFGNSDTMEIDRSFDRSLDDVSKLISHAKLNEADVMPLSQVVSFTSEMLSNEDLKLLEVTPALADSLCAGSTLVLRGEEGDSAVLCSDSATFDVKEAETSNSMLLLPNLSLPPDECVSKGVERTLAWREVSGVFYKYLELVEVRPRMRKLQTILLENLYTGEEEKVGPTFDHLLDRVQCSEAQLKEGLKNLEAVKVKGQWFVLDQDYQMKVLGYILRFFDENSWGLDCVRKRETVETLGDLVPKEIVDQVFDVYCGPMEGGSNDEFSLDKDKVCRFYGNFLLAVNTKYNLTEFLDMWQKAVPDGITTDISQLSGLILLEDDKDPVLVRRFTEASLPDNISDRLQVLFCARERWTLEEISPFVQSLTTLKLNVNALLTKHARPISVGATKYFCAKHGR